MSMSVKEIDEVFANLKQQKEYAMKKALQTILIVMMSLLALVSCSQEKVISDQLVSATLISTDRVSKALVAEVDFDIANVKSWKYTATKADNGLKTGETTTQVELKNSKTEALSQGSWNFTLYGYDVSNNCICVGIANNAVVTKDKTTVSITVNPSQTTDGKGKIVIADDITVVSSAGVLYSLENDAYTRDVKVYAKNDSKYASPLTYDEGLKAGSYTVVITFNGTADNTAYVAATGKKVINVYDNLTTTVSGTIEETASAAKLTGEYAITASASTSAFFSTETGLNSSKKVLSVSSTPIGTENSTSITFPAGSIYLGDGNRQSKQDIGVSVSASSLEKIDTADYTVDSGDQVVASLDFTITGTEVTTFEKAVEITTYITKGLDPDTLKIKYVGTTESTNEPTISSYDPVTGELKFTVHHFSEYIIVTPYTVVYDEATLTGALRTKTPNKTIRLVKDIDVTSTIQCTFNQTAGTNINLNGHTISSSVSPIQLLRGSLEFSGKGTIKTTRTEACVLQVSANTFISLGSYASVGTPVLTVGSDVTLSGGLYAISIDGADKTKATYGANGAVINMKGKIESLGGIYINGSNKFTDEKAPTINLDGATINTTNVGIYGAGYGKWNIKNTTITAGTPFSLKSGTFTIEAGTFTANGEYVESLTDDSNSSILTGSVLSLTSNDSYANTLSVTIKDGTFTSTNGYAIYEGIPLKKDSTDEKVATASYVTLDIQGGTFTGNSEKSAINLTEMTNKAVIKGGTFSSNPVISETLSYLADGYTAIESEGTWTVSGPTAEV